MSSADRSNERHKQKMAWFERNSERYRQGNSRPDPDDPEPMENDFTSSSMCRSYKYLPS